MYTAIFDGLRSYYAGFASRRAAAGFHAAMTMSFLFCVSLAAAAPIAEYLVNGNLDRTVQFYDHKFALVGMGVVVAYAHVLFAKSTHRYQSIDISAPPRWKYYFGAYCFVAAVLFICAVWVAAFK